MTRSTRVYVYGAADAPADVLMPDADGAIVREGDGSETWFPWSALREDADGRGEW
jgi:hypothetical protein